MPGTRLHVGCGPKRIKGYINTDCVPGVGEVVVDLLDLHLPASTFGEIYGCHVLEHVWVEHTPRVLRQCFEALQPGGTLRLSVPDARLCIEHTVKDHLFGCDLNAPLFGDYRQAAKEPDRHKQVFVVETLTAQLQAAGFVDVQPWRSADVPEIDAVKDWSSFDVISLNLLAHRPLGRTQALDDPRAVMVSDHAPCPIDVSVLMGTVDRPAMLRDCVESVRASLAGSGYTHEIIVAYGREDDPALPWLWTQPDIVPVLGGMGGAIPAFNVAYEASRGRCVCQINDDVLVLDRSIPNAIRHLDEDPTLGAVVFFMSRDGGRTFPDIVYDQQVPGLPHPNQIVARRELCEDIIAEGFGAFWGDDQTRTHRTYGGDSAWGLRASRLGWRIERREDVRLIDRMDETRNEPNRLLNVEKNAYDAHMKRWCAAYPPGYAVPIERGGLNWPSVYNPERGRLPRRSPIEAGPPERVLHIALSWLPKEPQAKLHESLAAIGPYRAIRWVERVQTIGFAGMYREVFDLITGHRPTLIWMQVQRGGVFEADVIRRMRLLAPPGCMIVSWTGDVRTDIDQPPEPWMVDQCQALDLFLSSECTYPEQLRQLNVAAKTGHMICGVDTLENQPRQGDPSAWAAAGKACFVGSTHFQYVDGCYSERAELLRRLSAAVPEQIICYGTGWDQIPGVSWERDPTGKSRFINKPERAELHSVARVAVIQSLFHRLRRYTSDRLQGSLYSRAFCAVQAFDDLEGYGLRDGTNCVVWRDEQDLIELLHDWLRPERDADRERIRQAGYELARNEMSWPVAVEQLLAIVREERLRRAAAAFRAGPRRSP